MLSGAARSRSDTVAEAPGLAIFFIDTRAVEAGLKMTMVELLEDQGHEALVVIDLNPTQIAAATEACLQDNGNGGERLSAAVVALDLLPMSVDDGNRSACPDLDNPKIIKALERARHLLNSLAPRVEPFDPLVATRNSSRAWQLVRQLFPEHEQEIRATADRMRRAFVSEGAIRDLTREGRRARVELVEFNGELAIRKTYRASAKRYMDREIEVVRHLAPIRPEVPKLLACADDHIIISYLGEGQSLDLEHRGGRPRPLPLAAVRALADFIKACVREGFDPIDIRAPGNVMLTGTGLKVIDFELWRRCEPGTRPEQALCLTGVPAGDLERPRGVPVFSKPYSTGWYPLTLLSLESFLYDPQWLQRVKRGANLVRSWALWSRRALMRRAMPTRTST